MSSERSNIPVVSRVLVVRFGALGDMVLLTAMIRRLNARFGVPVDVVSSGSWSEPLLQDQPGVGEIKIIASRRRPYWLSPDQRQLVKWLRERGPCPTWFVHPHDAGRELLRRGGLPDDLVCDFGDLPLIAGEHDAERMARFADETPRALAGAYPPPSEPRPINASLRITPSARDQLQRWLLRHGLASRSLIAIQAGNKRTMRSWNRRRATNKKYWPEERWAEVIRAIRADEPDSAIVLLGVPHEFTLNQDIVRLSGVNDVHNVADDLPVPVLCALLEQTDSMISVDTGPAHVAAAVGCPVVTLFADASPVRYWPGGRDTNAIVLQGEVNGELNMLGIDAERVIAAWRQIPKRKVLPSIRRLMPADAQSPARMTFNGKQPA
ncbi:MAG: glycosyltransferase family 9 protein [Povalibacter sp.]